jgi:hypothetical protein
MRKHLGKRGRKGINWLLGRNHPRWEIQIEGYKDFLPKPLKEKVNEKTTEFWGPKTHRPHEDAERNVFEFCLIMRLRKQMLSALGFAA